MLSLILLYDRGTKFGLKYWWKHCRSNFNVSYHLKQVGSKLWIKSQLQLQGLENLKLELEDLKKCSKTKSCCCNS